MEVETGDLGQYEELLEIESLAGAAAIRHRLQARGEPTDVIIDRVLVVPAFTRPLVPLDEGRFATSDLNDLYRRVVNRKNRLARLLELDAPEIILRNEARLLQEALEQLFDNDHDEVQTVTNPDGKPLRSLSSLAWGEGALTRLNATAVRAPDLQSARLERGALTALRSLEAMGFTVEARPE
jgi:DNA-directed RNA polymerase beta' subunit